MSTATATDRRESVDRALARCVSTVFEAAVERGMGDAQLLTALGVLSKGSLHGVLTYSFVNRSWMAEQVGLTQALDRVARKAGAAQDGELMNAAEAAKELVEKYKPASYDDIRAGLEDADKLLERLGYDEPTVKKALEAKGYGVGWLADADRALTRAMVLLEDGNLRAALGDERAVQLNAALEELELLSASLGLDPRVSKETTHEVASESELEVVNNTAPDTLDHVEEADALLEKVNQDVPKDGEPLPTGQVQLAETFVAGEQDEYRPPSFDREDASGGRIRKERGWQATDPTGGQWERQHIEPELITGDRVEGDSRPNGDSGRALDQSTVSEASPAKPEDEPGDRHYQSAKVDESVTSPGETRTFTSGPRTFQDGPGESEGPSIPVRNEQTANLTKAPGEDGMGQPTHLVEPKTTDGKPATQTRPEPDQRGADVNPLNLAMGDEDVRALGREWLRLAKLSISDPNVRLAFIRRAQDGSESEIPLE